MSSKVFIFGGCTSRDAVEHYEQFGFELLHYVARQSLISAFEPASLEEFEIDGSERPFRRRMVEGDIVGNLPGMIRRHAENIDIFIWDLMIERVGVAKVPSGGMVTLNGVKRGQGAAPLGERYVFGTEEHMRQWSLALDRFVLLLDNLGIKDKTIINATPWATHNLAGAKSYSESKASQQWFNDNVEKYWALAESRGIKVARVAQEEAVSDPDHKWGPAYFHYAPSTYVAQLKAISSTMGA